MFPFCRLSSGFLLVWVLPALSLAAAPKHGSSPPKSQDASAVVEHQVTRGETLWSISQKHHTSVGAIMDYNHLPDHNVREGMVLRIPPKLPEPPPLREDPKPRAQSGDMIQHSVTDNETFYSIGRHYGVPM